MSILIIPLLGLTATPLTIWAITTLCARRHHQHDQWAREYQAIEQWLEIITRDGGE